MCGRFTLRMPQGVLVTHFRADAPLPLVPRYNIAPTQSVLTFQLGEGGARQFVFRKWGLIPSWSKDPASGNSMINARAETVATKPAFRAAFKRRRCLVPSDGYYEWQATGGKRKQPYLFHLPDDGPFGFAGLWESWHAETGTAIETFTLITTDANEKARAIHDRMPVIIPPPLYDIWLDPSLQDAAEIEKLLGDTTVNDRLITTPVSTHVNNPRHEGPECIS